MYANPKLDPLFLGHLSIALGHPALNLNGAPNCIHHTGELDQHTVPGGLHDPTTVLGDLGVNESAAVGRELRVLDVTRGVDLEFFQAFDPSFLGGATVAAD